MDMTLVLNPIITPKLSYNAFKDFAPISLIAQNTSLLMVNAESGPKTVQDLIARAKANPGKLNYGAGTVTTHLAGYLFSKLAGFDSVFVAYKGSAEVVQGLLNGSIDFSVDGASANLPLIKDGKLRALAKLNNRPLPAVHFLRRCNLLFGMTYLETVHKTCDLRWEQVDFKAANLHVRRVKNGTPSTHPLTGPELRALRAHQRESEPSPFVFVSERGAPLTAPGFSRMVERVAANAKLGIKAHAHMLRHGRGYALANAGHDTRSLQATWVMQTFRTPSATRRLRGIDLRDSGKTGTPSTIALQRAVSPPL
jgi:tripartite tricarboxylate transporter family receptor/integrase-like protein